jgi:hypothetical protein
MRAPDQAKATADELADAIVQALPPWRPQLRGYTQAGEPISKSNDELRAEASRVVCEQIDLLKAATPEHFTRAAVIRTRDDARALIKSLGTLKVQLKRIKRSSPELRIRLGGLLPTFLADLAWMHECCEDADRTADKENRCKRRCVETAGFLIKTYSSKRLTIERTSAIAGLLHEAVTGSKAGDDLRWLCQPVVKRLKSKKI